MRATSEGALHVLEADGSDACNAIEQGRQNKVHSTGGGYRAGHIQGREQHRLDTNRFLGHLQGTLLFGFISGH